MGKGCNFFLLLHHLPFVAIFICALFGEILFHKRPLVEILRLFAGLPHIRWGMEIDKGRILNMRKSESSCLLIFLGSVNGDIEQSWMHRESELS